MATHGQDMQTLFPYIDCHLGIRKGKEICFSGKTQKFCDFSLKEMMIINQKRLRYYNGKVNSLLAVMEMVLMMIHLRKCNPHGYS